MKESKDWEGKAGEVCIPAEYIANLKYDILILSSKNLRTFQCQSYELDGQTCTFHGAIMDFSERNARGKITKQVIGYRPTVILANTGFMAVPIAKPAASQTPAD